MTIQRKEEKMVKDFYPKGAKRFQYYSKFFNTV